MVKMMNKSEFIKKLQNETDFSEERCILINYVLEKNFLIGKNNKNKVITELSEKLSIEENDAEKIYNISNGIILNEIKNKLKHPFGQ